MPELSQTFARESKVARISSIIILLLLLLWHQNHTEIQNLGIKLIAIIHGAKGIVASKKGLIMQVKLMYELIKADLKCLDVC